VSISYYLHTPLSDKSNEWPAISRLSRLMHRQFSKDPNQYSLIFNIEPDEKIITAEGKKLTQLDALLIGPKFVAIIELKSCFQPIRAASLTAPWYAGDEEFKLKAGSAENPYLQVHYARHVWSSYLAEKCAYHFPGFQLTEWQKRWEHLNVFLLLVPYLHPDSTLPPLEKASGWLRLGSIDDIVDFVFDTRSERLGLGAATVDQMVTEILGAKPWVELERVRDEQIGSLYIAEPQRPLIRIPLYRYDDIAIGRSTTQLVRIHSQYRRISGAHARLEVQDGVVRLFDVGSKNGTYVTVNGRPVNVPPSYILAENEWALLGTKDALKAVRINYTLHTQEAMNTADTKTIIGTLKSDHH
jgi:hypothetical protein